MHYPGSRIVGPEGDNDEAVAWKQNNVATRRVVQLQVQVTWVVGLVVGLLEDGKVVTMEMYLISALDMQSKVR